MFTQDEKSISQDTLVDEEEWPWEDKYGDYALVPVPKKETRSLVSIFYVYMGVLACIAVLWGGGTLGVQFNLMDSLWVAVAGSAILAVVGAFAAVIGGVSRCSTYVNLRPSFGNLGSQVFGTIVSAIPNWGWFVVQTWLFGVMMNTLFPDPWWASVLAASIWGGSLMLITAYFGFKGLAFFSYLAVPFFMLLGGFGFMVGVAQAHIEGTSLFALQPQTPVPFAVGVTEVVGMYIVGAIITSDICRYGAKIWYGLVAWVIQIMIFQVFLLVGAALLTLTTGEANIIGALASAGVGIGAFLMIFFGQWSTNDNNIYSSSLAFNLSIPTKRGNIVLGMGIVGVIAAAFLASVAGSAMEPFQQFLTLLGKALPAIGGVMISDFWLYRWYKGEPLKKRYQFYPGTKVSLINWNGWVSAIIATVLGGWVITWGIPALNCLWISTVLYILIAIICDKIGVRIEIGEHIINKAGR